MKILLSILLVMIAPYVKSDETTPALQQATLKVLWPPVISELFDDSRNVILS